MSPTVRHVAIVLAVACPTFAHAQDVGGAWHVARDRVVLTAARIALPQKAGSVGLIKTGEFSRKGESLDNVAQYQSADGEVFATAYIYRTTYADAALTAYATDRAILGRFGAGARIEAEAVVPFAGRPNGAIRQSFAGAVEKGTPIATMAAFARFGSWIVKLRASGPAARAAEVAAALDGLIAGASVDDAAITYAAAPLRIGSACPAADAPAPKLLKGKDANAATVIAGVSGGSLIEPNKNEAPSLAFPANGASPACVRGRMTAGAASYDLLQPADQPQPAVMPTVLDDLGTVVAVEKAPFGKGYTIKRYMLGQVEVAGSLDRAPTADQFFRLLTTKGAPEMTIRSTVSVKADGDTETSINSDFFK